jgi:hypothetical protein
MSRYHKNSKKVTQRSKLRRRALIVSLGFLIAAPLVGCGRKAPPSKPKDSKYPREYPLP